MEDPPDNTNSTSKEPDGPAQAKPAAEGAGDKSESSSQAAGDPKFYRKEWPLILTALGSLIAALVAFSFGLIIGESGIAWWHETPAQPPHELHLKPNQTYGRIGLRNLTQNVFTNVGVQLEASEGTFERGIFQPDHRDVILAQESRTMSTLETGPKTAPFVLAQHADRFDPSRTWFFFYSGSGLGEVTPKLKEGVARADFLELKKTVPQAAGSESKQAQPVNLHPWHWKDAVVEHKIWAVLALLVLFVVAAICLLIRWLKYS